jgi:hypothetical protein
MNKYLKKLKAGTSHTCLNSEYYFSQMSCGNGYKEGLKHFFYSDDETDIKLLINIIRRFRFETIITNITKNSFEFESKKQTEQIFFFRICRYVRRSNIKKILEDTIMINKSGVKIQNAFLLAHYYNYRDNSLKLNISYYSMSMDGFYDLTTDINFYLNKPFKLLKDFKDAFVLSKDAKYIMYNGLFANSKTNNHKKNKELIFKFLKEKDFKAAEKYLLHVWK